MCSEKKIPEKNSNFPVRELDGKIVLIDVPGENIIYFEDSGGFIWDNIDGKNSIEDIAALLTGHYQVEFNTALNDVQEFVDKLKKYNAVILK